MTGQKQSKTEPNQSKRGKRKSPYSVPLKWSVGKHLKKNPVAWVALAVSVLVGTCNYYQTSTMHQQARDEWLAINAPRLNVNFGEFVPFIEGDERNLHIKWATGYKPFLMASSSAQLNETGTFTQRYKILSQLVFWDESRGAKILGTKTMQSDEDVAQEAARLRLTQWQLAVHHKLTFRVVNEGSLPASKVTAKVVTTWSDKEIIMQPINIEGHKDAVINADIFTKLVDTLPSHIEFYITLEYDFNDSHIKSPTLKYDYQVLSNQWTFK